jgi:hypothetical protein
MAGYYGEQIFIVDSALSDTHGKVLFMDDQELHPGIYTMVVPGKLSYDFLVGEKQELKITLNPDTGEEIITGNAESMAFATIHSPGISDQQKKTLRQQFIEQYPETFLATYLKAISPIHGEIAVSSDSTYLPVNPAYRYQKKHFFDNMDLSDIRLLHTPLYHETIQFYFTQFITQKTDSLIPVAYRMLEKASGNYETFFYMSDFLIDFSLRHKIDGINRLHSFLLHNRYMLGSKAIPLLPVKSRNINFKIPNENILKERLRSMHLFDKEGQSFELSSVKKKYRILFFWNSICPRCLSDVSRWQQVLNKYRSKSCFGIAVNTYTSVLQPENRILDYDPICVNVSIDDTPQSERIFFTNYYSKIIVIDSDDNVIGIFCSSAALDNFLSKI